MAIGKAFRTWRGGRGGNISVMSALFIPAVLAVGGIAVDFQFTVRQKNKVQFALDSAVLAGALSRQGGASEDAVAEDVRRYTASLIGEQGGDIVCTPVSVAFFTDNKDIRGSIACDQPTFISNLMGWEKLSFRAASTSTYAVGNADVAFVFDVSGSMNSYNRLSLLKSAAEVAFDELLPDDGPNDGKVRLAITTYNNAVNAGAYFDDVTRSVQLSADGSDADARSNYYTHNDARMFDAATGKRFFYYEKEYCPGGYCTGNWDAARRPLEDASLVDTCVYERTGGEAASDAAPGSLRWIGAGNPRWNWNDSNSRKRNGQWEIESGGGNSSSGAYNASYAGCRASGPVPLTDNKAALKAHVQSLTANGGTAGHIGLAWGWYLLSPNWSSIWPEASVPLAYNTKQNMKAVILMTDGDFNTNHPTAAKSSFRQAQDLCDTMKAAPSKIQVYTVGFQVPTSVQKTADGRTILEYCATSPAYAFNASNGEELTAAYRSIARSISELRIKQ
ncbi:pilus assembly protein TadG-related protein [Hyphomonas sp.]|uniref:TadE/TadG family type IV pilus assembly protein n=1 Tax=Hyphomonas sp. TaxID=87 RepID=UPI003D2A3481